MSFVLKILVTLFIFAAHAQSHATPQRFGPFYDWSAVAYDGLANQGGRLLWRRDDGRAHLWHVDAYGHYLGHSEFPARANYQPVSFSQSRQGGHLLWADAGGKADLWVLDEDDHLQSRSSFELLGWQAVHYDANEGGGRLLWRHRRGHAELWILNPEGARTMRVIFGPERDIYRPGIDRPGTRLSRNRARPGFVGQVESFGGTFDLANGDGVGHFLVGTDDVNGDGRADLVSAHTDGNSYVWLGRSNGKFSDAVTSFHGTLDMAHQDGRGHLIIGLGDVTGDGRADLVSSHTNGSAYVWPGLANGRFGHAVGSFRGTLDLGHLDGRGHFILGVADVNGDGHADLVSRHSNGHAYVWPGARSGQFGRAVDSFSGTFDLANDDGDGHYVVDLADVNGDQRADLVSIHSDGNAYVWPGRSDGRFGRAVSSMAGEMDLANLDGEGVVVVGVADIDGDGHADLVGMAQHGDTVVWRGRSTGRFETESTLSQSGFGSIHAADHVYPTVALGDIDGDGNVDLVSAQDNGHVYVTRGTIDAERQAMYVRSVQALEDGRSLLYWVRADGLTESWLVERDGTVAKYTAEVSMGAEPKSLVTMPDGRMIRLSTEANGRAVVETLHIAHRDAFERIQNAYFSNDGEHYQTLLKHEVRLARRSLGEICVERLATLADLGCAGSLDGLASLVMIYHDCVVNSEDSGLTTRHRHALEAIDQCGQFVQSPKPNLDLIFAVYNGFPISGVRAESVRAVFNHLMDRPIHELMTLDLIELLGRDEMNRELCSLPTRNNEFGQTAIEDVARLAACRLYGTPGGVIRMAAICEIVLTPCERCQPSTGLHERRFGGGAHVSTLAQSAATPSAPARPLSGHEFDQLRDFCATVGGQQSAMGGPEDLGGFSHTTCFELGHTNETFRDMHLAETMANCLDDGTDAHPFAQGSLVAALFDDPVVNARGALLVIAQLGAGTLTGAIAAMAGTAIGVVQVGLGLGELSRHDILQAKLMAAGCNQLTTVCGEHNKCDYLPDEPGCMGASAPMAPTPADDDGHDMGTGVDEEQTPMSESPSSTGVGDPSQLGTLDLNNPACRELADLGLINGKGKPFWDEFFSRQPGRDPRVENVHPDDIRYDEDSDGLSCRGQGHSRGARCNTLILCSEGSVLEPETCTCQQDLASPSPSDACAATRCGPGRVAIPVGLQVCLCIAKTASEDELPPSGPIDPRDAAHDPGCAGARPRF